jgi:hypothetical protein
MSWLSERKIPYQIAGETKLGLPILMIYRDGRGRPVIITAGAHATEPSGVSAALHILENWNYSFPLYMFPLRDPLGCQSYATCLSHAIYKPIAFDGYDELNELLLQYADKVYIQNDGFLLVGINGLLFTNIRYRAEDAGPRQNERYINKFLADHPALLPEFIGRRVICPANMPDRSETVRCYERAFTAEISNAGVFSDMNRRFGSNEEPPEVEILRKTVDRVVPGLVLDLHEGFADSYYFFTSNYSGSEETRLYLELMSAACAQEFPKGPWRLSNLLTAMPELKSQYKEPKPGIIETTDGHYGGGASKIVGTNFSAYCSRYCPATTIESGIDNTFKRRVQVHLLCAKAALDHYENNV